MTVIDLLFPVLGARLPTDHGYALYSALSHQLKCLHDGRVLFGMAPVTGPHIGNGKLLIDPAQSRLRLRVAVADIPQVLPLAGKALDVKGHRIRLGVPQIEPLRPVPSLIARMVAIKNATESGPFGDAARRQLDELGVGGKARVPTRLHKKTRVLEPILRVLRIKEVRIVGFSLLVEELSESDSLRLQEKGLGGRRHLGCGVFIPARIEENTHEV